MKLSNWLQSLFSNRVNHVARPRRTRSLCSSPAPVESLEARILLTSDFGDAPAPYATTLADGGAEHITGGGLTLGATIDSEFDGTPSVSADADGADEDGVTFGAIAVGALDAAVTVNVQGAPGKLDAWIDFNGDGNWGGPGEQIAASRDVVVGDNVVSFDVPGTAATGTTYARFRLSTAGGLGTGGVAADGEVEDYTVAVSGPPLTNGEFSAKHTISSSVVGRNSVSAADMDGDGDMDVLTVAFFNDMITWYENDGSESFTEHTISTLPNGPTDVTATDMDGDGDMDVVGTSTFDDTVAWYENDGKQNFTRHVIDTFADAAESVFAADLDGDGDTDILSANANSNDFNASIAWYENDGSGNFATHEISYTRRSAMDVFAADVNGDGHMDVLSASSFDDTIAWYENGGNQIFTERIISTTADGAQSVFAADWNGDGLLDVASASQFNDTVAVYEQLPGGSFDEHVVSNTADGATGVVIVDIDGDMFPDFVTTSPTDGTIAWYEGAPGFAQHVIDGTAPGARELIVADMNSDGLLDVLATHSSNTVAWYEALLPVGDDYGDAPAPYATTAAQNGPSHQPASSLRLGTQVDGESDGQPSAGATGDDADGTNDEDGVLSPLDLLGTVGAAPTVTLLATNLVGTEATLAGWIDYDADGVFDNATERATVNVPAGSIDGRFTLTFPVIPNGSEARTYARFRLSTDPGFVANPTSVGTALYGEVEDYAFEITAASDMTLSGHLKLGDGVAGLPVDLLDNMDSFGTSVASLGDLNGDGVTDLAVGAPDDGSFSQGAVYILMLNPDGTVNTHQKIASGLGGLPTGVAFSAGSWFGESAAGLGDLDGDGVVDLAVGATGVDDSPADDTGAVYVLFMNSDGTVRSHQEIGDGLGGMPAGFLDRLDSFGASVTSLGDLDGDGFVDLAVGASHDEPLTLGVYGTPLQTGEGAVYVLLMNPDGTVKNHVKISEGVGGLPTGTLAQNDHFGISTAAVGDLDGDGVTDLAAGAIGNSTNDEGAVYFLLLNSDGTVKSHEKLADGPLGLSPGQYDNGDSFGRGIASLGDLDGDGFMDLAVGASGDDEGGANRGAVWILNLAPAGGAGAADPMSHVVGRDASGGDWWVAQSDGNSFTNHNAGFWAPTVGWLDVNTADVNGDGLGDVVGRDPSSGDWWVGLADANGNFTNQNWGVWASYVTWIDVRIADVNGDGNDDIVGRQQSNGNWWVAVSDGVGGFANQNHGFWDPTVTWLDVNVADVNGDGNDDVVGRQQSNGNWWVAVSDGLGSFANQLWGNWAPIPWVDVNIADVNGDGFDDVIGRQDSNGNWWVSVSDGAGSFTNQLWGNFAAIPWADVTVADVNGDGNDDVVARQQSNGNWWVGLSDGVSTFTNQLWGYWAPSIAWVDVSFGDVDGDGDDDIIGREQSNGRWWVGRSDGAGSFDNELWGTWDPAVAWSDVGLLDDLLAV